MKRAVSKKLVSGSWTPGPQIDVEVDCTVPSHLVRAVESFSGLTVEPEANGQGFLAFKCRITEATLRTLLTSEGLQPITDEDEPPLPTPGNNEKEPIIVDGDQDMDIDQEEEEKIEKFVSTIRPPATKRSREEE